MDGIRPTDGSRRIDWGKTSEDYARHRPGYPRSFYARLGTLDVQLEGLRVLDLGCGTGALSLALAERGARVVGIDTSENQVRAARESARARGLDARFHVASAEDTGTESGAFDLVTASQCWLYFDAERACTEVRRVLRPEGRLLTCHLCWLPRRDSVARQSEHLVLQRNPDWGGADWPGQIPAVPSWMPATWQFCGSFEYDEPLPFTRESWCGRIRACRGVGATLDPDEVASFDEEHTALLKRIAPPTFSVLHRIDAHLVRPSGSIASCAEDGFLDD